MKKAIEKMYEKIEKMDDDELMTTGKALCHVGWYKDDMWNSRNAISMDEWAEAISSERNLRNLPE